MRSLTFAIRSLFRTPFITATAIVSLALGIGATAGIFSVFHQVLLQSLAVPDPSPLVNVSAPGPKPGFGSCGRAGDCDVVFSYAMFRDLQKIQTIGDGYRSKLDTTIVGVVEDAKYSEVKQKVPPQFFVPYLQDKGLGGMHVYVRTSVDIAPAASAITAVVKRLDPNLPIEELETLPEQVRANTFLDRMMTTLSAAFALLATLLAAIGLYGVLAYTVAQRTREIGLRMALGAAPDRVRGMVLGQVAIMTLVGAVAGLAGAIGVGRGAQSLLFQMTGADPAVLALSAAALALVALCAGFIPAHRASRVDPMRALKYE